jgi:phosphoglycerol transferase MdoB-like AlkP superfamily enzyme
VGAALLLAAATAYGLAVPGRIVDLEWTEALTEAPLLVYLYALLLAPLRRSRWALLAAAVPLAALYLIHDVYVLRLGLVPNIADFALVPDLFSALSGERRFVVGLFLAAPVALWAFAVERPLRWPGRSGALLAAPALLAAFALRLAPAAVYHAVDAVTADEEWSDGLTVDHWGRLYAALLREARRAGFSAGLRGYTPIDRSPLHVGRPLLSALDGRNVHVVVLESFVDVRRLEGVRFSSPPVSPEFAALADPFIGSSVSPVFGGETARAEFEVLCGVPSLRLYGLEFLSFTGAPTYCLPRILRDAGYHTVLTFPHGPIFFNTRRAYPALGFEELLFGDRYAGPGQESVAMRGQDYLFDGDLFPQNLDKVARLVREGRPFLNYVLTIYGHWPFDIDEKAHPSQIDVTPPEEDLRKIANQMRLRTEALAAYLAGLRAVDPRGIIVMVADHLPPLVGGPGEYARLGYASLSGLRERAPASVPYENFLLVVTDAAPRKLPLMRHFDLPHWILDELSHGAYCREKHCDFGRLPVVPAEYLDRYRTILGLAAGR